MLDFGRGEVYLGGVAVDQPPNDREDDAGCADDDEHPTPADGEHEEGEHFMAIK